MSSDMLHIGLDIGSFFKQKNISSIFTLCGGHISPILVGCEKENIDIILSEVINNEMPKGGPYLSADEIQLIRGWQNGGFQ